MSQKSSAYTFSDMIARFGRDLIITELGDAYRRAGDAFRGQLQQNFVVLHDWQEESTGRAVGGPVNNQTMGGENRKTHKSDQEGESKKLEDLKKNKKTTKN
jgi:hypothetical protein